MAQRQLLSVAARKFLGSSPSLRFLFNMKKVYMIHGWGGSSGGDWFPWLKKELEKRKIHVYAFDMPDTEHPRIDEWVKELEYRIDEIDEETYFIGHSIGCQTILRFLEKLHKNKKIGGCLFVAPWFNLTDEVWDENYTKEIAYPWLSTGIHFDRITEHCTKFWAIFSDDDPYVPISDKEIFKEKLNARIIVAHGREHFIQKVEPSILKETLNFLKIK